MSGGVAVTGHSIHRTRTCAAAWPAILCTSKVPANPRRPVVRSTPGGIAQSSPTKTTSTGMPRPCVGVAAGARRLRAHGQLGRATPSTAAAAPRATATPPSLDAHLGACCGKAKAQPVAGVGLDHQEHACPAAHGQNGVEHLPPSSSPPVLCVVGPVNRDVRAPRPTPPPVAIPAHLRCGWTGKHVAAHGRGQHASANEASMCGLVACTAAADDCDPRVSHVGCVWNGPPGRAAPWSFFS